MLGFDKRKMSVGDPCDANSERPGKRRRLDSTIESKTGMLDLPRELRDLIYAQVLEAIASPMDGRCDTYSGNTRYHTLRSLLLSARIVMNEFEQQLLRKYFNRLTLLVEDNGEALDLGNLVKKQAALRHAANVHAKQAGKWTGDCGCTNTETSYVVAHCASWRPAHVGRVSGILLAKKDCVGWCHPLVPDSVAANGEQSSSRKCNQQTTSLRPPPTKVERRPASSAQRR